MANVKLSDIAVINNRSLQEKMLSSVEEKDKPLFVFVPIIGEVHRSGKTLVTDELLDDEGYYVNLKMSYYGIYRIDYIAFELGSLAAYIVLFFDREKKEYKKRITKKQLTEFEIREESLENQNAYGYSAAICSVLAQLPAKTQSDKYFQLRYSMFTDVRDSLGVAQIMAPSMRQLGIKINMLEAWKELLEKNTAGVTSNINALYSDLLDDNNSVMNEVRKLRIVFTNMANLVKNALNHGDVENK